MVETIDSFFTFLFVILGIAFFIMLIAYAKKKENIRGGLTTFDRIIEELTLARENFNTDKVYFDCAGRCGIAINRQRTQLLRIVYSGEGLYEGKTDEIYRHIYDSSQVLSSEIVIDNAIVTNSLGVVNSGVVLKDISVVHGSSTSTNVVSDVRLNIVFQDDQYPYQEIYFKNKEFEAKEFKQSAFELNSFLNIMVANSKNNLSKGKEPEQLSILQDSSTKIGGSEQPNSEQMFNEQVGIVQSRNPNGSIQSELENPLEMNVLKSSSKSSLSPIEEIQKISEMKSQGLIDEGEYSMLKKEIIDGIRLKHAKG